MSYTELHCISNFTFLRGASHPEELVLRAQELGYAALAITDECSLAGVVRAHVEAKQSKLPLIIGSEFRLDDGLRFVLLATDRASYGNLSALITRGVDTRRLVFSGQGSAEPISDNRTTAGRAQNNRVEIFDPNGKLLHSSEFDGGWQQIIPDTIGEQLYAGTCSNAGRPGHRWS